MTFGNGVAQFNLGNGRSKTASGLPDGTTYTVTETQHDQNGYVTTVTTTGTVDENKVASGTISTTAVSTVEFTNTKDTFGDIELRKQVNGTNAESDKEFTFTVTILKAEGEDPDVTYVTDTAFAGTYGDATFTAGVATLTLKANDAAAKKIEGLPNGTRYKIEEADYSADGYPRDQIQVSDGKQLGAEYTITGGNSTNNSNVSFTVTNYRRVGSLTVSKTTTGTGADTTKDFHFTVSILNANDDNVDTGFSGTYGTGGTAMTFTAGVASFTLKHGETKTATNLPAGIRYKVEETDANSAGYRTTVTYSNDVVITGTIQDNQTAEVAYTNTKIETVTVNAGKAWNNIPGVDQPYAVKLALYRVENNADVLVEMNGLTNPQVLERGTGTVTSTNQGETTLYTWPGTVSWNDLPKYGQYDLSNPIVYMVKETEVKMTENDEWVDASTLYLSNEGTTAFTTDAASNTASVTITNTEKTNNVYVVKRWYDAYGNKVTGVQQPVTMTLYNGDNNQVIDTKTDVVAGSRVGFNVSRSPSTSGYYVVETNLVTGFTARYTTEPLDSSVKDDVNDRLNGYANGNQVKVPAGGTLYVMNTPGLSGAQTVFHKKWIVFSEITGQFYFGQLDGADMNTDAYYMNNMQLDVEFRYKAIDVTTGTEYIDAIAMQDKNRSSISPRPNEPGLLRIWYGTTSHPGRVISLQNMIVSGNADLQLIFTGGEETGLQSDWKWGFLENSGSGQYGNGTNGYLPAYGYYTDASNVTHLVRYEYYFTEKYIYDGSTNWSNPTDVTNQWWKREPSPNNSDETLIENRPLRLPVTKQWQWEGDNSGTVIDDTQLYEFDSIVVTLYCETIPESGTPVKWVHDTLTLYKNSGWSGTFTNLERYVTNKTVNDLNDNNQQKTVSGLVRYSFEEAVSPWYEPGGMTISTTNGQSSGVLINKVMPKGSIQVVKAWEGTPDANAVLLKLYRHGENESTAEDITAEVAAHPERFGLTAADILTIGSGAQAVQYIQVRANASAPWNLTISGLFMKKRVNNSNINCYYYVEEVGYVDAQNAAHASVPGSWVTTYSGGASHGVAVHDSIQPNSSTPATLTVTNTTTGSIKLKKIVTVDGAAVGNNTTGTFTFTITGDANDANTSSVSKTVVITLSSGGTYSATIRDTDDVGTGTAPALTADQQGYFPIINLPLGAYTITESDAGRPGYNLVTTFTVGSTTSTGNSAMVTLDSTTLTATVDATNAYTAGVELPATGGPGTVIYTASGLTLLLGASLWLLLRRRREQNT